MCLLSISDCRTTGCNTTAAKARRRLTRGVGCINPRVAKRPDASRQFDCAFCRLDAFESLGICFNQCSRWVAITIRQPNAGLDFDHPTTGWNTTAHNLSLGLATCSLHRFLLGPWADVQPWGWNYDAARARILAVLPFGLPLPLPCGVFGNGESFNSYFPRWHWPQRPATVCSEPA